MKRKAVFLIIVGWLLLLTSPPNAYAQTSVAEWLTTSSEITTTVAEVEEDRVVHEAVYPDTYDAKHQPPKFEHPKGVKLGYTPNTIRLKDMEFPFEDMRGNSGAGKDFDKMMTILDENKVVQVGKNKIHSFFGHYYDLTGTGVFNPIVDHNLIEIGSEAIITDKDGYSKGYEFTQILEILNEEQERHYYENQQISQLAYNGKNIDMLYLQYCRWDIELGLLKGNIAYRIW